MIVPQPGPARSRLPAPPPSAVAVELEVPFHHVDLLEVAWYGHYPKYLDAARTALLRARRLDKEEMRALGLVFMVSESYLRHAAPLRYGDRLRVAAWLTEVENRVRIAYQVRNLTAGGLAAEGWTAFVTVRIGGGLCLETPPEVLARLREPGPGQAP
jgi:acyl-CoA thioester hydrolase